MSETDEINLSYSLLIMPTIILLIAIGWFASPRNEKGRPLLLLADVKAVEEYRRLAMEWHEELRLVDGEITVILTGETGDLFGVSRGAQKTFEHILRVTQDIDRKEAPPTLVGLRTDLNTVSLNYLESARLALRWISVPSEANYEVVQSKLTEARSSLKTLESSRWLATRSP